jgi:transposase
MSYIYFIGIDISKDFFEIAHHSPSSTQKTVKYSNDDKGFKEFSSTIEDTEKTFIVLEATGGYETGLLLFLCEKKIAVHRISPLKSSHYMRSIKSYAKNDVLDAMALARYGFERHETLTLFSYSCESHLKLSNLFSRKQDLISMRKAEKQRQKHPNYKDLADSLAKVMECLDEQIKLIDKQIQQIIDQSEMLKQVQTLLLSQKGVGIELSVAIMAQLPEIGLLDRKQIASLAGVAPHPKESGNYKGYRRCKGGRMGIRRILFMAILSAVRYNTVLSQFYQSLTKRGKKPMVAMTATMRKMIIILNAKVRDLYSGKTILEINGLKQETLPQSA